MWPCQQRGRGGDGAGCVRAVEGKSGGCPGLQGHRTETWRGVSLREPTSSPLQAGDAQERGSA